MKVDFHSHCFEPTLLPPTYQNALVVAHQTRTGSSKPVGSVVDRMRANMNDPDGVILRKALEDCGIDHAFVIGLDFGFSLGDETPAVHPRQQLQWAAGLLERHPDGFFSFAFGIGPRRPEAAELTNEALTTCAVGVKLYPPAGFRPDDDVCDPIYDAVIAHHGYVIAHTGRQSFPFDLEKGRVEPYASVQRKHPGLTLVLGHAGVPSWGYEAIEVAKGHATTLLEVSGWRQLLDREPARVRDFLLRAWDELGPSKVLFGSDVVSGPGIASRFPLLRRWVEFYEATAEAAGIDIAAAAETALRALSGTQVGRDRARV